MEVCEMETVIVVHGGAGAWDLSAARLPQGIEACREAAMAGQAVLVQGGTALDAVETAVRILEDCPVLDAGRGSYLNREGNVEMDAMIMDGRLLDMGAVGAVQRVQYPISLARRVMQETEHTFLVADGAGAFADAIGFPRCELADLLVGEELAKHEALRERGHYETDEIFVEDGAMGDTVGAVALDKVGNMAAATSTGGTRQKLPGRVGDSPLVGSGTYADNETAAVSATGHGEKLMKVVICKQVCDFVAQGVSAQVACEAALHILATRVEGKGGLIAVDKQGRVGVAFNTTAMPYAYGVGEEGVVYGR